MSLNVILGFQKNHREICTEVKQGLALQLIINLKTEFGTGMEFSTENSTRNDILKWNSSSKITFTKKWGKKLLCNHKSQ